jgi:hypothetical protein
MTPVLPLSRGRQRWQSEWPVTIGLRRSADVFVATKGPREQTLTRRAHRINGRHPAMARTVAAVAHQEDARVEGLGRAVRTTSAAGLLTCGRRYSGETLLQGLAYRLQDVAPELGPHIEKEHAVVRPRPLARQRHLAAADQPPVGDGRVRGAEGAGRDQRRAGAGAAGNAPLMPASCRGRASHHAPADSTRFANAAS